MTRLVSTHEAAAILGLSIQGVHYRIKTNKLESIKKHGKTYVYIETNLENQNEKVHTNSPLDMKLAFQLKDEQITLLKKSIKWMKRQHKSEIQRLEKNQNKIIEVFQSEVNLLQKAYNEMQSLYKRNPPKLNHHKISQYMSLKEFITLMKKYNKTNDEIKELIFRQIKLGDTRFSIDKKNKKLTIKHDNFIDII